MGSDSQTFPRRRLRDVGVVLYDCEHKTPKPSDDGYPYIAIPDIRDGRLDLTSARRITPDDFRVWTRKIKPQAGDIIVTRRGRVGDTAVVPPGLDCAIGQNLVILRSEGDLVDQRFLRWALRGPLYDQEVDKYLNVGAVFSSLNCRHIPLFEIPVPTIGEQRRIAGVLGALDAKIEALAKVSRGAEAVWRLQYDLAIQQGLKQRRPVGEFVELVIDRASGDWTSERYVALEDMPPRSIDLASYRSGSAVTSSVTRFRRGDILFGSMRPYFHKVGLAQFDGITRTTTFVLRPRSDRFRGLALHALSTDAAIKFASDTAVGSTIPYVKWETLSEFVIDVPEATNLEAADATAIPLVELMASNANTARLLASVRDLLLPRLISGQIRVSESYDPIGTVAESGSAA